MNKKKLNAQTLWKWKGETEEHKYKKEIRESKRYMQKLVNRMASRKGISEKQLMNYIKEAKRIKGATGNVLLQLLEMRLDNIVFRLGMAPTVAAARQLVGHKHILINNACVSIPSYQCQPGDILTVKDSKSSRDLVLNFLETLP